MVAIFTGGGTGFERGSGNVLGAAGLIGNAASGRSGQQLLVNAATGNLMVQRQDTMLVGLGPDAALQHTYNSLGSRDDMGGDNWRVGGERRLDVSTRLAGYVTLHTDDGSAIVFLRSAGGGVTRFGYGSITVTQNAVAARIVGENFSLTGTSNFVGFRSGGTEASVLLGGSVSNLPSASIGIRTPRVVQQNGYTFTIDQLGRTNRVEATLVLNNAQGRNRAAQLRAGGQDRLITDEGSHVIGRVFNGPTGDVNLFAQNRNFNRGAYRALERRLQSDLQNGSSVSVNVFLSYPGSSRRPSSLVVDSITDGVLTSQRFINRPGGR